MWNHQQLPLQLNTFLRSPKLEYGFLSKKNTLSWYIRTYLYTDIAYFANNPRLGEKPASPPVPEAFENQRRIPRLVASQGSTVRRSNQVPEIYDAKQGPIYMHVCVRVRVRGPPLRNSPPQPNGFDMRMNETLVPLGGPASDRFGQYDIEITDIVELNRQADGRSALAEEAGAFGLYNKEGQVGEIGPNSFYYRYMANLQQREGEASPQRLSTGSFIGVF
ncbi:uncharacterized protein BT62DRAFT_1004649 [Guyanagaster necrorhizus]|uniref:Uncharacterized protein n=1 Tax=Guyanagaster necrorhizus TaxID=856835 RepID=A0A9P8AVG1_9AGAR|nr:uncharacterized protein BT62DRAFT_1004649 [Guyanagaster necrorhizus MCA 3950]KAG7447877.1 hypothetical protein BT62DRAFT_1004649 [Guyanagaster necrorhizus MCA 3950]